MRCNRTSPTVVAIILLASSGAIAQDLRPDSLNAYGGTYSPSCSDAAAARVQIAASGLVIGRGSKQVRTPARMDSATSFGGAPTSPVPEGYRIEFIGDDFSLYVFEDAKRAARAAGRLHTSGRGSRGPSRDENPLRSLQRKVAGAVRDG